jgi:hypothetical protein
MVMLYRLLVDALSAAADDQPPGAEPLQPFTALMDLFEAKSGNDSLGAVTFEMISAAQRDLAAALFGSEIPGGLCHRFGQRIKDHAEWLSLRKVMPNYRLPSEEVAESRRLVESHAIDETVLFIPLFGGKCLRSLVCEVLPSNRYRLAYRGQEWEASGARLEKYKKKPSISPNPFLNPPPLTSDKTNCGNVGGPSALTNCSGAATGQPSNKRLKPSGQAGVKTKKRSAAKQKRKGGNVAKVVTTTTKKCRFEVAFSQVEGDGDPVVVAEVVPVDTDDSDVEHLDEGALDELHRMALLREQEKESKHRILLETKERKLKDRMRQQQIEFEIATKDFIELKVRQ